MKIDLKTNLGLFFEEIRYQFDHYKHITTLDTGCILIGAAFIEKVFKNPKGLFLIVFSFFCFFISLGSSVIMMRVLGASQVFSHEFLTQKKVDDLEKRVRTILSLSDTHSKYSQYRFLGGIFFILIFIIFNLKF